MIKYHYGSYHGDDSCEISKEITDIDYFKYFNEINSIELNNYYVIFETIKDNLILLHKYIPLQEFKHSSFPNNLQFMIDEISKQQNDLQIIKGEYKELETQVLNLLNDNKSRNETINKTFNEIASKYKITKQKVENMYNNFSKIQSKWYEYDFKLNSIFKQIRDESKHK